ncbi:protein phosphatase 2C domain-containing protein [Streptacidiphilus pinicola]|uniref:Protein phosphatase 2C domain-containing protein n=1 Tax=Streptacidiphilus pinicola TaxID=2219663 RepID=A0A2X0I6B2_9ACTN|nr:protein phosphatase 2C domain-containing protein [Streptacidiphilus pinicola]
MPEPDALPEADPEDLGGLVPDTVLELARHGSMTLRAASARGEDARALGAPRGDRMIVARFGDGPDGLLVTAVASGPGATEAVRMLAASVGRSRTGLLADLRHGAQEQLRFGLQRLTARAARGLGPAGAIHALLAPLDPTNRLRAGFGTGVGALLLLGDDAWYDAYAGRRLTNEPESAADAVAPQAGQFRFRAVVPEPGDVLLLCTEGLATPLRAEPAVAALLAAHWCQPHAPAGVDFLRQIQARASGHSGDRTAAAIWEE